MSQYPLVIIPTYNEAENIEDIIEAVLRLPGTFHILVVDDNSPDGTAEIVERISSQNSRVHLLLRKRKEGLGKAYLAGFRWALDHHYAFVFEMDADFSHPPEKLPEMLRILENDEADMVIGSRYLRGRINVVNWDLKRILLSYFASLYVRFVTGIPVRDTTAGFVGYKAEVLKKISPENIRFIGYAFQIEMKYRAWKKGFRLKEIPIIFTDRIKGKSKMSGGIISEAFWGVLKLRWDALRGKL